MKTTLKIIVALILGATVGALVTGTLVTREPQVNDEALSYARKFMVMVTTPEGDIRTIPVKIPSSDVKVFAYQEGGQSLTVTFPNIYWWLVIGIEDWSQTSGSGDFADTIIKIYKTEGSGTVNLEVGCLGGFDKKVYYDGQLELDTSMGVRWKAWEVST